MTKKTRNWSIVGGIAVILIGAIAYGATHKKPNIEYTTADVTRGTLTQTVSETGTITPAKEIELNFPASGQLIGLAVKVGDQVKPNQPLGQIDSSNLAIRQREAMASLSVSQANSVQAEGNYASAQREYEKLSASLKQTIDQATKTLRDLEDRSSKTVTTSEQAIASAETNLSATKTTYQRGIANKQEALSSAIDSRLANASTALDASNRILSDEYARADLGDDNPTALREAKLAYANALELTTDAKAAAARAKASPSEANLGTAYASSQAAISRTLDTLNVMFVVLRYSSTSIYLTQAQLDAFKASIDGQLAVMSTANSALQSARQAYSDAQLAYDTNVLAAEQNLTQAKVSYENALTAARNALATATSNRDQQLAAAQTRVDSTQASVTVMRAQVTQAQANVALVNDQLADNTLKSPIAGTITKLNYQVGEQVSPSKPLLSVLTENNFQLEVDIAETDIAKIHLNDQTEITLDSLGEETKFQGMVYFIDPAETVIQGVTYYKVKISFDPGKQSVKPGMTADAVITTDRREDVLMMPARAVVEKEGKKIVRILENGNPRESEVTIGLSGDDGMVEVTSGVNEGEKVVTFIKDASKK